MEPQEIHREGTVVFGPGWHEILLISCRQFEEFILEHQMDRYVQLPCWYGASGEDWCYMVRVRPRDIRRYRPHKIMPEAHDGWDRARFDYITQQRERETHEPSAHPIN